MESPHPLSAGAPQDPDGPAWLPAWIEHVGFACWLSDPRGSIASWNRGAETLFERRACEALGHACHAIVGGTDDAGERFCCADCKVRRIHRAGGVARPLVLRRAGAPADRGWILVGLIPLRAPDGSGPWILHCAYDVDLGQRTLGWVERIARRSGTGCVATHDLGELTGREREILEHLARDEDPKAIARGLHVSYATVRNHVQHILAKLGVHSIQEAIALHLLTEPEPAAGDGRGAGADTDA